MVYADASAFYGMNAMWDKKTHAEHFAGRGGEKPNAYLTEEDTIVLADNDANAVLITGMGYAIGHYARWLNRGAVRLEANSDDSLVLVTAFKDDKTQRAVLVIVNNAPDDRTLGIAFRVFKSQGQVTGEQSYGHSRWQATGTRRRGIAQRIRALVRAMSVTTLSVALAENPETDVFFAGRATAARPSKPRRKPPCGSSRAGQSPRSRRGGGCQGRVAHGLWLG